MTTHRAGHEHGETTLLAEIGALLADSSHHGNPLRSALERLYDAHRQQSERLGRLVRISDGYHDLTREHSNTLADCLEREMHRLQKLVRISDLYQGNLHEMAEALRDASLRDPLTGLGNRRYLMDRLKEESARALRKKMPLCVGILDVDHFKRINDSYGHDTGDLALRRIAGVFDDTLREYDVVGRWGGEEFLILLPDTALDGGLTIAERIRVRISELRIEDDQHPGADPIILTVSIGLSMFCETESISAAVTRADNALLSAKRAGRNRCLAA